MRKEYQTPDAEWIRLASTGVITVSEPGQEEDETAILFGTEP